MWRNPDQPVVLVNVPPCDPTQSYSSLPMLSGYLRREGFRVIQKDAAIDVLNLFLSRSYLGAACERARVRAERAAANPGAGSKDFLRHYHEAGAWAGYVADHLPEALKVVRNPDEFYDARRYHWAVTILDLACELCALPHYPSRLTCATCESPADLSLPGLLAASENTDTNLYYDVFERSVVPDILALNPLLIGLSATYHFQLEAAVTLGRLLKRYAPEVHVVIGGAIISCLESHLLRDPEWFQFADSYVIGEGETALARLSDELLTGAQSRQIPNLVSKVNGRPFTPAARWYEDIHDLPAPDFDGVEFEKYLSPEPILLLSSTRGCYYGKCAFCDVSRNTQRRYRGLGEKRVSEILRQLTRRYGAERFMFCDDAMPPKTMREVARLVQEEMPPVTWQAEARLEKCFTEDFVKHLKAGGCRQLIFGFESACSRVLEAMNKGNTVETDRRVLRACADQGIALNLQTFVGFPTETRQEAMQTVRFLIEHERMIASIGFGTFKLFAGTPVERRPERFGIDGISLPDRDVLLAPLQFESKPGMSRQQAASLSEKAMERLTPIYSRRSHFVGGAAGSHTLLYFSRKGYAAVYDEWRELDRPLSNGCTDLDAQVLIHSPSVLISKGTGKSRARTARGLSTETGSLFELSPGARRLWDLFDGTITAGDAAARWAGFGRGALNSQVRRLGEAYGIILELLNKGLLVPA